MHLPHFNPETVTGPMKKFGLIGHPIAHSLSPALFKAAYGGRHPYDLIEEADFEKAYENFMGGYDAINVTAPFKEAAYNRADIITTDCKAIGATNLLVKTPEGIMAYNSDFLGVRKWLEEVAVTLSPSDRTEAEGNIKVLIAGYGGAGKAAAAAARSLGMEVSIVNRTPKGDNTKPLEEFCNEFRTSDIIIYNIPASIDQLDQLTDEDCRGGRACKPKFILEANYRNPSFTPERISHILQVNPKTNFIDGRIWLLYQAVTGYEIMTGDCPDIDSMKKVME